MKYINPSRYFRKITDQETAPTVPFKGHFWIKGNIHPFTENILKWIIKIKLNEISRSQVFLKILNGK